MADSANRSGWMSDTHRRLDAWLFQEVSPVKLNAPGVPSTPTNNAVLQIILAGADFAYWSALRVARRAMVRFMGVKSEVEAQAPATERRRIFTIMADVLPLSRRLSGLRKDSTATLKPLALPLITAPTLIITAKDDLFNTLSAARVLAEGIPSAKLVVLESGGHLLVNRHGEVSAAIADFLTSIECRDSGA
jgi:2-hydroxy-6-oxonona-2,4-dienedioate hydrolase